MRQVPLSDHEGDGDGDDGVPWPHAEIRSTTSKANMRAVLVRVTQSYSIHGLERRRAAAAYKEKAPVISHWGFVVNPRQRPTLPPTCAGSTIGGSRLNFRVRNGNGCDPAPMATGKLVRLAFSRSGGTWCLGFHRLASYTASVGRSSQSISL